MLGMYASALLKEAGFSKVFCVDVNRVRLTRAADFGAIPVHPDQGEKRRRRRRRRRKRRRRRRKREDYDEDKYNDENKKINVVKYNMIRRKRKRKRKKEERKEGKIEKCVQNMNDKEAFTF